jgi:hypothetical protein
VAAGGTGQSGSSMAEFPDLEVVGVIEDAVSSSKYEAWNTFYSLLSEESYSRLSDILCRLVCVCPALFGGFMASSFSMIFILDVCMSYHCLHVKGIGSRKVNHDAYFELLYLALADGLLHVGLR